LSEHQVKNQLSSLLILVPAQPSLGLLQLVVVDFITPKNLKMTTRRKRPEEQLDICPYNLSHVLRLTKLGDHVLKCRDDYMRKFTAKGVTVPLYPCYYNNIHQIPEIEIDYHHEYCPSRENPAMHYFQAEAIRETVAQQKPPASAYIPPPPDPNWPDDEEENKNKVWCPAAHMGYLLPAKDRLLPRQQLWDKIQQVKVDIAKAKIERMRAEYEAEWKEEQARRMVRALKMPAIIRAQMEAEKKMYEEKKAWAIQAKKDMWELNNRLLMEALERRRLENEAKEAKAKKEQEEKAEKLRQEKEEQARLEEIDLITFDSD
jgi:hypothetical protein